MKQYMKSVMTMALMLLFTSGAWADPTVNIKTQLNGVDNNAAGTATSDISNGVCTLTVTPASGNYVTKDFITASSSVTGNMAQTRGWTLAPLRLRRWMLVPTRAVRRNIRSLCPQTAVMST